MERAIIVVMVIFRKTASILCMAVYGTIVS